MDEGTPPAPGPLWRQSLLRMAWAIPPALLVAAWVAWQISPDIPFDSDEANHANLGLKQFQDLQDGRLMDFVRHSYRTGQFPFLHGWMLIPGYALFGATLFAARITQVLLLVIGAGAAGHAAYRACGDDLRAGAAASWLFALSPALATYSGLCMLEVPGAAMTAITLAVFSEAVRACGRRALLLHALTALAALGTYFTKLNYGLWIAPAIAAGIAVQLLDRERRGAAWRYLLVYLGTLLVCVGIWYSRAEARATFMGFLNNPAERIPVELDDPSFSVPGLHGGNFFAYFPLVADAFHVHGIIGVLAMLFGVWGLVQNRRHPVAIAAAACVAWTWLILSMGFREYALARFIASALPALWILTGLGLADAVKRLPPALSPRLLGTLAIACGLGGLTAQFVNLPDDVHAEYEIDARMVPVFQFVTASVPGPASVLVVNYTDHTTARTIHFDLSSSSPDARFRDFDVTGLIAERIFESADRFDRWMTAPRPWGSERWGTYLVELSPGPNYIDNAVVLPETVELWHSAVMRYGERLERVTQQRFNDLDVTVTVWRDRSPPIHRGH